MSTGILGSHSATDYVAYRSRHYVHVVDLKKGDHLDTTGHKVRVKFNFQNERTVDDVAVLFHSELSRRESFITRLA